MEKEILKNINTVDDLAGLSPAMCTCLAEELRSLIISTVLKNGGHLASSLGTVEIIIALERIFTIAGDDVVFDVGHQAYAHKILTGRREAFATLRTEGGISGFPKRSESAADSFGTGHASTSISAALGMARARRILGQDGCSVALIGDGALTGGESLEALNDAGSSGLPIVIILNDNDMSISVPRGALREALLNMRVSSGYLKFKRSLVRSLEHGRLGNWLSGHMYGMKERIKRFLLPHLLFEDFGFVYLGPYDGHDEQKLEQVFRKARQLNRPVIIHCITEKGHLYPPAAEDPERFHGIGPASDGMNGKRKISNSAVFGNALCSIAGEDASVLAITAAMPSGTGLTDFSRKFPERFFDVGICEEHAVTMAAGMACKGLRPVVAIYSTFLQRGYDQIIHDVCLQGLPVVFAVDRAGLTGEDGETHQGIYDLAFLSTAPGMKVYVPADQGELEAMLEMALSRKEPAAIRYGRGSLAEGKKEAITDFSWKTILPIGRITVLATGPAVEIAEPVCRACGAGLVNARFPFEMDDAVARCINEACEVIITMEDGILCFGTRMQAAFPDKEVVTIAVPNVPVPHAPIARQREMFGLDGRNLQHIISLHREEA